MDYLGVTFRFADQLPQPSDDSLSLRTLTRSPPIGSTMRNDLKGSQAGVEANLDAHMVRDAGGAIHTSSPKARFIFPALAVAAAGLSFLRTTMRKCTERLCL